MRGKVLSLAALFVCAGAMASGGQTICLLTCDPAGGHAARLRMVVLNAGRTYATDEAATVSFDTPALKTLRVPLATSKWDASHAEVVEMGTIDLSPPCPAVVVAKGGVGDEVATLGRIRRIGPAPGVEFTRAWPGPKPPAGKVKLFFAATYEALDGGQFAIRLACFDCGQKLAKDYDLFLHFEFAPTGQNLDAPSALGLYPSGVATDASQWGPGEVFVARFGPYHPTGKMPERVYLRAGMYDRVGDGSRLPVVGTDDTDRAYVGCIVTKGGRTWFERPGVGQ